MTATSDVNLWSLGRPGSLIYRTFDWLRDGLNRRLARFLLSNTAEFAVPGAVLEPGSGPGRCADILAMSGRFDCGVALDLDRRALSMKSPLSAKMQRVQADLFRMPFADGRFSLVFNSSTLEHLDDFSGAFREMVRVVRPGGFVFIGVPARRGPFWPFAFFPAASRVSRWMGRLFSMRELTDACRHEQLSVHAVHRYFFGCFVGVLLRKNEGLPKHVREAGRRH